MPHQTLIVIKNVVLRITQILIFLAIVLVISYSMAAQAIFLNLTKPITIQNILSNNNFSMRSRPAIADLIFTVSLDLGNHTDILESVPLDTWEDVAEIIFPSDWIEKTLEVIIQSTFSWLNNPTEPLPKISIDLSKPIEILGSRQGALAVLPLLQRIPMCNNGNTILEISTGGLPDCLPIGINYVDTSRTLAWMFSTSIMAKIDLEVLYAQGFITESTQTTLKQIHTIYTTVSKSRLYGLLISIILLGIYSFFQWKHPIKMLHSIFLPILFAGVFSLLLIAFVWVFMQWGWNLLLSFGLLSVDANLLSLINDLGKSLTFVILKSWLIISIILGVLSLVGWIFLHPLRFSQQKKKYGKSENDLTPRRTIRRQFR